MGETGERETRETITVPPYPPEIDHWPNGALIPGFWVHTLSWLIIYSLPLPPPPTSPLPIHPLSPLHALLVMGETIRHTAGKQNHLTWV